MLAFSDVDEEFRNKVKEALGKYAAKEGSDEEDESESDDNLDDDAMLVFDQKIAAIFRERKKIAHEKKRELFFVFVCVFVTLLSLTLCRHRGKAHPTGIQVQGAGTAPHLHGKEAQPYFPRPHHPSPSQGHRRVHCK